MAIRPLRHVAAIRTRQRCRAGPGCRAIGSRTPAGAGRRTARDARACCRTETSRRAVRRSAVPRGRSARSPPRVLLIATSTPGIADEHRVGEQISQRRFGANERDTNRRVQYDTERLAGVCFDALDGRCDDSRAIAESVLTGCPSYSAGTSARVPAAAASQRFVSFVDPRADITRRKHLLRDDLLRSAIDGQVGSGERGALRKRLHDDGAVDLVRHAGMRVARRDQIDGSARELPQDARDFGSGQVAGRQISRIVEPRAAPSGVRDGDHEIGAVLDGATAPPREASRPAD